MNEWIKPCINIIEINDTKGDNGGASDGMFPGGVLIDSQLNFS